MNAVILGFPIYNNVAVNLLMICLMVLAIKENWHLQHVVAESIGYFNMSVDYLHYNKTIVT